MSSSEFVYSEIAVSLMNPINEDEQIPTFYITKVNTTKQKGNDNGVYKLWNIKREGFSGIDDHGSNKTTCGSDFINSVSYVFSDDWISTICWRSLTNSSISCNFVLSSSFISRVPYQFRWLLKTIFFFRLLSTLWGKVFLCNLGKYHDWNSLPNDH